MTAIHLNSRRQSHSFQSRKGKTTALHIHLKTFSHKKCATKWDFQESLKYKSEIWP
jgi:hypothetical protein